MADFFKAFLEFLIDLFAALGAFLGEGKLPDFGGAIGEIEKAVDGEEG